MPIERFFSHNELKEGDVLVLQDQEFHHLVNVTRIKAGEQIELVNGRGSLAEALVIRLEKKQAILSIISVTFQPPPPAAAILAQAIPRINRLDFILEKGTELGMSELWLYPASESERKTLTDHQLDRMRAITISAMKQCGRLYLPKIEIRPPLSQWKQTEYAAFYGDVEPNAPVFAELWIEMKKTQGVLFFIGPESGFTAQELAILKKLHAKGVRLHPNILRTDTAALAALSLITHWQMATLDLLRN